MSAHLQLVADSGHRAGTWRIAEDGFTLQLVVDGAPVCDLQAWPDPATGEHGHWTAVTRGPAPQTVARHERLTVLGPRIASQYGVVAPISAALFAGLRHEAAAIDPLAPHLRQGLLERFAELLARILDEPLATLPGHDPGGHPGATELRLAHYRPDLSEHAAVLLEEAGF